MSTWTTEKETLLQNLLREKSTSYDRQVQEFLEHLKTLFPERCYHSALDEAFIEGLFENANSIMKHLQPFKK